MLLYKFNGEGRSSGFEDSLARAQDMQYNCEIGTVSWSTYEPSNIHNHKLCIQYRISSSALLCSQTICFELCHAKNDFSIIFMFFRALAGRPVDNMHSRVGFLEHIREIYEERPQVLLTTKPCRIECQRKSIRFVLYVA